MIVLVVSITYIASNSDSLWIRKKWKIVAHIFWFLCLWYTCLCNNSHFQFLEFVICEGKCMTYIDILNYVVLK